MCARETAVVVLMFVGHTRGLSGPFFVARPRGQHQQSVGNQTALVTESMRVGANRQGFSSYFYFDRAFCSLMLLCPHVRRPGEKQNSSVQPPFVCVLPHIAALLLELSTGPNELATSSRYQAVIPVFVSAYPHTPTPLDEDMAPQVLLVMPIG